MPPSAGPRARARLNPALLSETASGNCSRGTSSGMIACHAGLFIAVPMLSRKVRMSNTHGEMMLKKVSTLRSATALSIQACQKISSRRRSKMSAVAPAKRPSITTGKLAAVCIRAMSNGDGVSTVISQVPAVSCIQPPRLETVEADPKLAEERRLERLEARGESLGGRIQLRDGRRIGSRGKRHVQIVQRQAFP